MALKPPIFEETDLQKQVSLFSNSGDDNLIETNKTSHNLDNPNREALLSSIDSHVLSHIIVNMSGKLSLMRTKEEFVAQEAVVESFKEKLLEESQKWYVTTFSKFISECDDEKKRESKDLKT